MFIIKLRVFVLSASVAAILAGAGVFVNLGCDSKKSTNGAGKPESIKLLNQSRQEVNIVLEPNTVVVASATWCPFSKQLRDFLKEPRARECLAKYKFVFVFEADEWSTVERHLREAMDKDATEDEVKNTVKALKAKADFAPVFDPSFFGDVGGEVCFLPSGSSLKWESTPSVLSHETMRFDKHPLEWMFAQEGIPRDELMRLWKSHAPKEE